eukprot:scpid103555/ scgid23412/ 
MARSGPCACACGESVGSGQQQAADQQSDRHPACSLGHRARQSWTSTFNSPDWHKSVMLRPSYRTLVSGFVSRISLCAGCLYTQQCAQDKSCLRIPTLGVDLTKINQSPGPHTLSTVGRKVMFSIDTS